MVIYEPGHIKYTLRVINWGLEMKKQKKFEAQKRNKKPNTKVIIYSLIALGFVALTVFVDWIFIIGAIILVYLNQKELMKKELIKKELMKKDKGKK